MIEVRLRQRRQVIAKPLLVKMSLWKSCAIISRRARHDAHAEEKNAIRIGLAVIGRAPKQDPYFR